MNKLTANQLLLLISIYIGNDNNKLSIRSDDEYNLKLFKLIDDESNITDKGKAFIKHCKILDNSKFTIVYNS